MNLAFYKLQRPIEFQKVLNKRSTEKAMPWELLVTDTRLIKSLKNQLELEGKFVRPIYRDGDITVVRTSIEDHDEECLHRYEQFTRRKYHQELPESANVVAQCTRKFLEARDEPKQKELMDSLPLRYSIYPPLLLFNNSSRSFASRPWQEYFQQHGPELYFEQLLQHFPGLTHVAINMPIVESDVMRRPFNIQPLHGQFNRDLSAQFWVSPTAQDFQNTLWCQTIQNGIQQHWAPMFTMFSRGNVTEKECILYTFEDIEGNDVVDLYAGIGYFTLSYLKRGARNCLCFELNPWSTEALRRGIVANKIDPRTCHIYNEDNVNCIRRIEQWAHTIDGDPRIRHINLGLLPSSKKAWPLAQAIISLQRKCANPPAVVTMHIHENVHINLLNNESFIQDTIAILSQDSSSSYIARHLEKIKTFAPDVWHVCLDVDVASH